MSDATDRDVYTAEEIAARLGVDTKTVYRAVKLGQLPARQLGRLLVFPKPAFEAWLQHGAALSQSTTQPRRPPLRRRKKAAPLAVVASERAQDPHQKREG